MTTLCHQKSFPDISIRTLSTLIKLTLLVLTAIEIIPTAINYSTKTLCIRRARKMWEVLGEFIIWLSLLASFSY